MTRYVLGFLFARGGKIVLLIKKARGPANVIGRLNGIGGKIQLGETPAQAMRREAGEEAGIDVQWTRYGAMGSLDRWVCDLFYAVSDGRTTPVTMDETEPVCWCRVDDTTSMVDNLPALLALAALARDDADEIGVWLEYVAPKTPAVEIRDGKVVERE